MATKKAAAGSGTKAKAVRPKPAKWVEAEAPAGAIRDALLKWAHATHGPDGWASVSVIVSHLPRNRGDYSTHFSLHNPRRAGTDE